MKISELIDGLVIKSVGDLKSSFNALCQDSRRFNSGDVFVAIRGAKHDGHSFIESACLGGAAAIVINEEAEVKIPNGYKGAVIRVDDTRRAMDLLASNFFCKPSEKLFAVAVTGTNGKTTTSIMVEHVLSAGGLPTGVIGTIDNHLGAQKEESINTTPGPFETQEILSRWVKAGARALAMEVSSHGLSLGRVDSVHFDVGIFTNLTRDHLDFHGTMDHYRDAKGLLFHKLLKNSHKKSKRALLNFEDPVHKHYKVEGLPTWTFGIHGGDLQAKGVSLSLKSSDFKLVSPAGTQDFSLPMIGRHNVLNALGAIGAGLQAGLSLDQIAEALTHLNGVRGRLERVSTNRDLNVFVDYAHTDDALINVLSFLSELRDSTNKKAKIITVFGCGGDRDRGKRPLMMKAAQKFSNLVVVTSDNPRTEDPEAIIEDILKGADSASKGHSIFAEVDRRVGIKRALEMAGAGDVILIAGKGHEDYQILGTQKVPFDDIKVAKEFLK